MDRYVQLRGEIVRELPQFRRERAAGLSLSAYLASKVVVLGAITILQIIVYVLIATAAQHGPNDGSRSGPADSSSRWTSPSPRSRGCASVS